ncbi:MAG: hypothetical protein JW784_00940 [Candidatus Cloacimonetes bacterium]|nr:hypothetical protein [Candidatus Cloacimonadota bacterium]
MGKRSPAEKEELLRTELGKWQKFRATGIIEVNYHQYSFRKDFLLQKEDDRIRIDIMDGGIFGLQPSPFLSVYLDSCLIVKTSGQPAQIMDIKQLELELPYLHYLRSLSVLWEERDEFIRYQKVVKDDLTFTCNSEMQIINISSLRGFQVSFNYRQEISEIILAENKKTLATLKFDQIGYHNIEVVPLLLPIMEEGS